MAVTITQTMLRTTQGWDSIETLTQSTATTPQTISLKTDVTVLGMGTATGHPRNQYNLASGAAEGQEKLIISNATGEAYVFIAGPTEGRLPLHIAFQANSAATSVDALLASATGRFVFNADGDFLLCKYLNGTWHFQDGFGATMATAT